MKGIFALLILVQLNAFAQQVYLPHEVETQAGPVGGVTYLNQFLNANLQIPFKSSIKGLNGRVYVRGVVEPDGSMSNVEIARGIDALCNAEAVRVMSLFKAWKPALIKGKAVKQSISYPVTFKSPPRSNYDSTRSALIDYYDSKYVPTTDPAKIRYRMIIPVDENGYVKDDVVYEEEKGAKWKQTGSASFEKKEIWFHLDYSPDAPDSVKAFQIAARDQNMASHSSESVFQPDGKLLSHIEYGLLTKKSLQKSFDLNGMVRKLQVFSDSVVTEVSWYENGQIKSVIEVNVPKSTEPEEKVYVNAWNKEGQQTIKDGDGFLRSVEKTFNGKYLIEEGKVVSGVKNGKWTGKWLDSTLHYTEQYELGVLNKGLSYEGGKTTEYTVAMTNPQFKGGLNAFYKFLAQNIQYPVNASRNGVSARVKLSFVVCEDGSMCDYQVENRVGFGLDEEALRVVKKMEGHWEPGVLRGKPVRVRYFVPINFEVR
ncbi:energy transducer TonB [Dyadobacter sp. CY323]|uniref:energy transducer TonB n=1 Tax=Dyadobacter sp. CY323 TaxID=2907302 RepID=UPI001F1DD13B|nr:energy transducer TonB [Dyadobacter sp. CY323]MCE6990648.1 energy transducer TonB [Dyadobacter sp. CY323]